MVVAGALALSLVQLGAAGASAASPAVVSAPVVAASKVVAAKPASVGSRPDLNAAAVSARVQGSRVEAEAERSATSTTWANPDGTLTTEQHQGLIRFRDANGGWQDVDLTLAEQADGSVAPKGHPGKLRLKGATRTATLKTPTNTENDVVSADEGTDGTSGVSLAWAGPLGKPVLAGNRATYTDAQPGVDLVVDVLRSGYEQSMVIKTPAALAGLSADGADVSWSLPVKTRGLTARAEADGSVSFVNAKDVVASRLAAPKAWDAVVDPRSGEHTSTAAVKLTVARQGKGNAVVTMTPDQGWLSDPARVFPVTIDPTYASVIQGTSLDTYVSSLYPAATYSTATELRVGTYGSSDKYRSFLTFPLATIKGKQIKSASLSLYEFHSWSCTASPFYVYSAYGASSTTSWSNQPAAVSSYGSLNTAKGWSSSCAAGRVSVPVTALITAWSGSTSSAGAVRLHASETDANGWKKFYSVESTQDPYITFTYNRLPNTPGTPTHTPGVSSGTATAGWTSTTTPTLKATVSDPDGETVQGLFSVYLNGTGTPVINKAYGSVVASGGTSVYTVPAGKLVNGSAYVVRVWGYAGAQTSTSWSTGYDRFVVDTTIPNPPTVSSTTWTAGAWTPATGGTISWTDTSPDATLFSWKLDTGPWSAFGAARSQVLSALAANTQHTFSVRASDASGHISAATNFTFWVGVQATTSGARAASQPVAHQLSDTTGMSLNPTNGNVALTGSLLHLRGVGQDLNIGWRYNGLNDTRPTLNTGRTETALVPWTNGSFSYVAPDGGAYTFTKSGTTWVTPAGINATLTSPAAGTMALRFNPSGVVNTYVNTAGVYQLTQSADKNTTNANLITYTYTGGKLSSITDTQGRVVTFAYTDANNPSQPSTITDTSLSRTISLAYAGAGGALSQVTDATGAITTLGYDATGLISLTINGNQTTFDYDQNSRLTSWAFGAGSAEQSDWAASYVGALTTITDGNSNAAKYTIAGSTTTKITDPTGVAITSSWDAADNLLSRTDTMGNLTTNTYGSINNLLSGITSPAAGTGAGASVSLTFPSAPIDAQGSYPLGNYQPNATKDAQGNTAGITYDANTGQANQVTTQDALGAAIGGTKTSTIQGDDAGTSCGAKTGELCTTSNGNNNLTTYGYDSAGNPTSITPPAPLGARDFTYDPAGRVLTATDGRGNTSYFSYDGNDRITQVAHTPTGCPAATCVAYTYDDAGNLTTRTSPTGATSIGYDGLNRPTTKTQAAQLVSTATYDQASNLTSYTDTTGTTSYGYNSANRLVSLAEPGGSCPVGVTTPNATACTMFTYDFPNRATTTGFPNGQITTKVFDKAGRVTSITAKTADGATTLSSRAYAYQSATPGGADQALRASMTDQAGTNTTYRYDGLNRLNQATTTDGTISSWTYDNDGNRTSAAKSGTATVYSAYNGADQLCWSSTTNGSSCASPPAGATTYSYDDSGNQTSDKVAGGQELTNSFNVFNQLTDTLIAGAATLTSTYAGTGNTERLSAGATSFLNGTLGITSQTTAGTSVNYIRDPSGNLIAMRAAGQSYYYTSDAQGSVIALTDSNQALAAAYTYDPWGNTTSTGPLATTNPWTYATGYTDTTTGYLKLGARYYNPTTGRFTQPDPSGQEPNIYNYASCNPANYTDPSGYSACSVFAYGLGTIISFASLFIGPAGAPTFLIGATMGGTVEAGGCEEPPNQDYGVSEYGYGM